MYIYIYFWPQPHNNVQVLKVSKVAIFFLNILQEYYQLPILGVLGMSGRFYQKQ